MKGNAQKMYLAAHIFIVGCANGNNGNQIFIIFTFDLCFVYFVTIWTEKPWVPRNSSEIHILFVELINLQYRVRYHHLVCTSSQWPLLHASMTNRIFISSVLKSLGLERLFTRTHSRVQQVEQSLSCSLIFIWLVSKEWGVKGVN